MDCTQSNPNNFIIMDCTQSNPNNFIIMDCTQSNPNNFIIMDCTQSNPNFISGFLMDWTQPHQVFKIRLNYKL
ncbi:hypothetical protein RIR_jg32534.t1 [Rhizophagus irregularis DAOM 181602=DAOM 197198]|nr:hypothetical protein RIR_jg32534.t1 [Rhizophagus irregularis DAOM 181602=DAOM 197198]